MRKRIIVDINVVNLEIRALKPEIQNPTSIPNDDVRKMIFWNSVGVEDNSVDRLNKRTPGYLKGKALRKAEKIVDKYGGINISDEYGSIKIDEKDFIPSQHATIDR
jgi:hypothetical protein